MNDELLFCQSFPKPVLPSAVLGQGELESLAWSPDASLLAAGTQDGVWLYNAHDFTQAPRRLGNYRGRVFEITFNPQSDTLAFTDGDFDVYVMDVATGASRREADTSYNSHGLAFSPNGRYLAIGGSEYPNTAQVWNVALSGPVAYLGGHTDDVVNVVFTPDGSRLLTVSKDATIRLWDTTTYKTVAAIPNSGSASTQILFSADGSSFITVNDKGIQVWDAKTGDLLHSNDAQLPFSGAEITAFSPSANLMEGFAALWKYDPQGLKFTAVQQRPYLPNAVGVKFSPDGTQMALAASDGIHMRAGHPIRVSPRSA